MSPVTLRENADWPLRMVLNGLPLKEAIFPTLSHFLRSGFMNKDTNGLRSRKRMSSTSQQLHLQYLTLFRYSLLWLDSMTWTKQGIA